MAKADPARSLLFAVECLIPATPRDAGHQKMVRFLAVALVALFVVILALSFLIASGQHRSFSAYIALGWVLFVCAGAAWTAVCVARDRQRWIDSYKHWSEDSRRLSVQQFGLDLKAGRLTRGLTQADLYALADAADDWRESRESLLSLNHSRGEFAKVRSDLILRMDEAMRNLLAEAGAGQALGPSPFLLERARSLFAEVGAEANDLARTQARALNLQTDESIEALRLELDRLRDLRQLGRKLAIEEAEILTLEGS